MRKFFPGLLVFLMILFPTVSFAAMEAVQVGFGSLVIGGVFQGGMSYHVGDELPGLLLDETDGSTEAIAMDRPADVEFWIRYARMNFRGQIIDDRVKYFVQLELNPQEGDLNSPYATENNLPYLLDAKLGLKLIPYTTLWAGRYAPKFTYFNSLNVARLGLIEFPLMNKYFGAGQRQTGLDIDIDHRYFDMALGVSNGLNYQSWVERLNPEDRKGAGLGNVGWSDENTQKDFYATIAAKPVKTLRIWAGYWYGRPNDYFRTKSGNLKPHDAKVDIMDGGLAYLSSFGLTLMGEFFYTTLKYDNDMPSGQPRDKDFIELAAMSYYGRLGFNMKELVGVPLELMGQYDYIDPDTTNDEDTHGSEDEITHYTGAVNYYLKDHHAAIMFNYIYKVEEQKFIEKDGSGEQTGLDDDEIQVQFQVAF